MLLVGVALLLLGLSLLRIGGGGVGNHPLPLVAYLLIVLGIAGLCRACYTKMTCTESRCGEILVYTMRGCPWCTKAKDELTSRGLCFKEIEYVRGNGAPPKLPDGETPMAFPSIWVNGRNVGGYSEMYRWIDICL